MLYDEHGLKVGYASPIWPAGLTLYFLDSSSTIRVKNGILQLKNETDGLWYSLLIQVDQGIRNLVLSDIGEA